MGSRFWAFGLSIAAFAASPAAALATQRYAAPTPKGSGDCSSSANACSIVTAINSASVNDEVIVAGDQGTYGSPGSPISTGLATGAGGISIHGAAGAPRPVIYSSATLALDAVNGATVSNLAIYDLQPGGGEAIQAAATVDRFIGVDTDPNGTGCSGFAGATFTNSVCVGGQYGGFFGSNPGTFTDTLRNDTFIGGTWGFFLSLGGTPTHETVATTNTIIHGGTKDVGTSQGTGAATVTLDHSNYATVDTTAGGTVTPAGSGTNQTASPVFANAAAGDYHEAPSSPTIDRGITSPANGSTDLDGNPRALGASTDIGAYEYVPPNPTVAPVVSKLKINHSKFKLGKHRKKPTISYTDSKAGTVTFSVYKVKHGKRGKLLGIFTQSARAGGNSLRFSGKVQGKKLRAGNYELAAVPSASGLTGAAVSLKFQVR